jgi:hypothetical protein
MRHDYRLTTIDRLWAIAYGLLTTLFLCAHPVSAHAQAHGAIRGTIVDARDGTPLEKVSVRVQETKQTTQTASDGTFQLEAVPAGIHELYVSSVDYILIRRTVDVPAGGVLDITIPIAAGTGTYSETVDVSTATGEESKAGTLQVLRSNELQQLRGLVTNDPMRAIHVLPGVATGDDLRSEFSVRGLPVRNMNFTFEGVSTPLLVHTVQGVQDSGSIAMINGDVLQEIALAAGSYPQRHGNHTGAELNFLMREGSRDRVRGHVGASVTDTSLVLEGPLGRSKRGSWLFSARKSYLDMIIKKLDPENDFGFGFYDVQSKLVYDLNAAHQVQFAVTAGRSRLDQSFDSVSTGDVKDGVNDVGIGVVTWRYLASPRFVLTQRLAAGGNRFRNVNKEGVELQRGTQRDIAYRGDWSFSKSSRVIFEGGGELRRSASSRFAQGFPFSGPTFEPRENFDESTTTASSYVMTRVARGRASVAPGIRVDHSTLTGHTSASPWIETQWPLGTSLTMRAGGGVYRQAPGVWEVKGLRGSDLKDSRAYHADVAIEGPVTRYTRWKVSAYNREDRDYPWLPNAEFRVTDGDLVLPSFTTRYENALNGHSRGLGLLLQRRSPNRLSGWIAYDLSFTEYRDRITGETFDADYDQRHTVNMYGVYRFSDRMSFSSRFRAGSNFPAPGYYESRPSAGAPPDTILFSGPGPSDRVYFVGSSRNNVRVPFYSRLDVRANRTFTWKTTRLTLFAEALNLYGRDNVRASGPGINGRNYQVFGIFDSMFPMIPSAGILLEF